MVLLWSFADRMYFINVQLGEACTLDSLECTGVQMDAIRLANASTPRAFEAEDPRRSKNRQP